MSFTDDFSAAQSEIDVEDDVLNLFGSRKRKLAAAKAAGYDNLSDFRAAAKLAGTNIRAVTRGDVPIDLVSSANHTTSAARSLYEIARQQEQERMAAAEAAAGEGKEAAYEGKAGMSIGGNGLSTGAIIGIAGGGLAVLGLVMYLIFRKRNKN